MDIVEFRKFVQAEISRCTCGSCTLLPENVQNLSECIAIQAIEYARHFHFDIMKPR
jgi:hypothetical protein